MNSNYGVSTNKIAEREDYFMKKILIGMGIVFFFLIIPFHYLNFNTNEMSTNKVAYDSSFQSIAHGNTVSQQFVPQYNHIKSLKIVIREIACDMSQGYLQACILDSGKNLVREEKIPLAEVVSTGWRSIFSEVNLIKGQTYYLNLNVVDTLDHGPGLAFYPTLIAASKEEEGQELTYAGVLVENGCLKVSFEYEKPLYKSDYLAYYLFVIFISSFFIVNIKKIGEEK